MVLARPQEALESGLQLKQLQARAAGPQQENVKARMIKRLQIMRVGSNPPTKSQHNGGLLYDS